MDDEKSICLFIEKALKHAEMNVITTTNLEKAIEILQNEHFNIILLDYEMPEMTGFEFLAKLNSLEICHSTDIILMAAFGDDKLGLEAIHYGCIDYLAKPFSVENLVFRVKKILEEQIQTEKLILLTKPLQLTINNIIGNSEEIQKINKIIAQVADYDATILLEGETGTGKELVARAIHENSKRHGNLFIPVNCGALTETLLESELFGYEKGAFTGAANKKFGIMESANNGTVFLDEINNSSPNVQIKLLRFIESGEFLRVGGNSVIKSDTRIIAASNQGLEKLVAEKQFREDLYHRLNVIKIIMPPLRNRKDDIILLINHFFDLYNNKFNKKVKVSKPALNCLNQYYWPGNIRQLKNVIQSLVLLNETNLIKLEDIPETIHKENTLVHANLTFKDIKDRLIADFEIKYLNNLCKETKGNVSRAAAIAHINRQHLIEKLKIYNINPSSYKK